MKKTFSYLALIFIIAIVLNIVIFHKNPLNKIDNKNSANAADNSENSNNIPDVIVKDLEGNNLEFKKIIAGKVTLLNFWATWCPPCRQEMPMFEKYYEKYKDKGLEIVSASVDKDVKSVISFKKDNNISFKIIMANENLISFYGPIKSIPTTFILDNEGKIKNKFIGFNEMIETEIKKYLEIK